MAAVASSPCRKRMLQKSQCLFPRTNINEPTNLSAFCRPTCQRPNQSSTYNPPKLTNLFFLLTEYPSDRQTNILKYFIPIIDQSTNQTPPPTATGEPRRVWPPGLFDARFCRISTERKSERQRQGKGTCAAKGARQLWQDQGQYLVRSVEVALPKRRG